MSALYDWKGTGGAVTALTVLPGMHRINAESGESLCLRPEDGGVTPRSSNVQYLSVIVRQNSYERM